MNELESTNKAQYSLSRQEGPQNHSQPATPAHEVSLRDFFSILRRRKVIVLQTLVVVLAMGCVITFMTRPKYSSSTRILVEGKSSTVAVNDTTDPLGGIFLPQAGHEVNTQVEVLRSPILLSNVSKELRAREKDVFVDVRQVGQTDVIELKATSNSRDLAQKFAEALPRVYLKDIKVSRLREVTGALDFARRRLRESTARLKESEKNLQAFKSKVSIVDSKEQRTQDINALSTARANVRQAEGEAASTRASYLALQSARRSLPRSIESPTTSTNPQIEILRQKIADARGEREKLLFLYKPDHEKVIAADNEIRELQRRLDSTPAVVTSVVRNVNPLVATYDQNVAQAKALADAAAANLRAARSRTASLEAGIGRYNPIERTQSQLDRDILVDSNAVAKLTASVEDLNLRRKAIEAKGDPITIIENAAPAVQVTPNVIRNILMTCILAVLLASGAALLQDSLDDHLNDEDEARWLFNTPILGHLPFLTQGESRLVSLRQSDAQLLERFRVLRANVQFTLVNRPNRVLQITSTVPEEGKSSVSANLAISIALDARRVILVDADLHRPKADKLFGLAQQPGLTNVLVGQATLEEALQDTDIPGLRLLTAGVLPPNSAELLNSAAMDDLIEEMKGISDLVIFDSPPCLATADAQVLAAKVDGVIYVMELGKVRKSNVQRSFELLYQARANVLGVVFNKMNTGGSDSYYNYEYYGYSEGKVIDDKQIEEVNQSLLSQMQSSDAAKRAKSNSGSSDDDED